MYVWTIADRDVQGWHGLSEEEYEAKLAEYKKNNAGD